jgi:hypothetical protein
MTMQRLVQKMRREWGGLRGDRRDLGDLGLGMRCSGRTMVPLCRAEEWFFAVYHFVRPRGR